MILIISKPLYVLKNFLSSKSFLRTPASRSGFTKNIFMKVPRGIEWRQRHGSRLLEEAVLRF
jgi:hypothetical protein